MTNAQVDTKLSKLRRLLYVLVLISGLIGAHLTACAADVFTFSSTAPQDAFTVKTSFKFGSHAADRITGMWIAGISSSQGAEPDLLALTWSPISFGWFGESWGLQLASKHDLLPQAQKPKDDTDFLAGYKYINLTAADPEDGHEYEATLGYTPSTGALSISVTDSTTGVILFEQGWQLEPYQGQLYPSAGLRIADAHLKDELPGHIQSIDVLAYNQPRGVNWWISQDERTGYGQQSFTLDRRLATDIVLRLPWQELPGDLHLVLNDGSKAIEVAHIARPQNNTNYPISVSGVNPGRYRIVLKYTESDRTWDLGEREVAIGRINMRLEDLTINKESDGTRTVTGDLVVQSDGAVGNLVTGINLSLKQHVFDINRGAGTGTIQSYDRVSDTVVNERILNFTAATSTTLPFKVHIPLSIDDNRSTWQITLEPFSVPDTLLAENHTKSLWLGRTLEPVSLAGFLTEEFMTTIPVVPGVDVYRINGKIAAGPVNMYLLQVDLTQPGISVDALVGRHLSSGSKVRFPRSQVSQHVSSSGAIAGVNASFFEISSSMVPNSMLIRSWEVLRSPDTQERGVLGIAADGSPYIGKWQWQGEVRKDDKTVVRLNGINPVHQSRDAATLYRAPWLLTPGVSVLDNDLHAVDVVLENVEMVSPGILQGKVTDMRHNPPGSSIPPGQVVLVGRGHAADLLTGALQVGDTVEIAYTITGSPEWPWLPDTTELRAAASGGVVLLKNGLYESSNIIYDSARHPRTVVAVSYDRRTLYLLVVDGRSKASVGMTYKELADFFLHVGAFEALNMDGGGSSALSIRPSITGGVVTLNTPSDGAERYVPDGVGIFYNPPNQ